MGDAVPALRAHGLGHGALQGEGDGIFQRMLSAPVTRGDILWSKFLYGTCLGLIQLTVLFMAGEVLYGIEIGRQFGLLFSSACSRRRPAPPSAC
jgi:hypothetical protein